MLAGIVLKQPLVIWTSWVANSKTKAIVLDKAFTRRGIHFYNKIENVVVWASLNRKHKNDIYSEKKPFYPLCGILTPR